MNLRRTILWALVPVIGLLLALLAELAPVPWQAWLHAAWASAIAVAVARLLGCRRQKEFDAAVRQAMRVLDQLRNGTPASMPMVGPPEMQALMRKVSLTTAAAEERSRQSRAGLISLEVAFDRIHSVLNSLYEGVLVVDKMGEIVLANPAARRHLRDGGKATTGEKLLDTLDPALRDRIAAGFETLTKSADGRVILTGLTKGDDVFDVSIVRVKSNRPDQDFGTVLVVVDVTEIHVLARMKDRFLSSVSHELRTPLTNICSFVEILEQQLEPIQLGECNEFLGIISRESHRLALLVEDVLDFNTLDNEAMSWHFDKVAVRELLDVVEKLIRQRAIDRRVGVDICLEQPGLYINVDRAQLLKALDKLLDNAVKFAPEAGSVRIEVRAVDTLVQLSIEDSGPGVRPEHRETVFESFSQLGDTLTDKPSGAGLGLAIARRVVDRLGGSIWCDASDLGGAAFRLVLPLCSPPRQAKRSQDKAAVSPVAHGADRG